MRNETENVNKILELVYGMTEKSLFPSLRLLSLTSTLLFEIAREHIEEHTKKGENDAKKRPTGQTRKSDKGNNRPKRRKEKDK